MHSQRLSRQFGRTVNQLLEIQKTRRDPEARAINQALDLLETAEKNGESYDPSADGFVFSKPEIATAVHLRNRPPSPKRPPAHFSSKPRSAPRAINQCCFQSRD
jgi:hypothetical protein